MFQTIILSLFLFSSQIINLNCHEKSRHDHKYHHHSGDHHLLQINKIINETDLEETCPNCIECCLTHAFTKNQEIWQSCCLCCSQTEWCNPRPKISTVVRPVIQSCKEWCQDESYFYSGTCHDFRATKAGCGSFAKVVQNFQKAIGQDLSYCHCPTEFKEGHQLLIDTSGTVQSCSKTTMIQVPIEIATKVFPISKLQISQGTEDCSFQNNNWKITGCIQFDQTPIFEDHFTNSIKEKCWVNKDTQNLRSDHCTFPLTLRSSWKEFKFDSKEINRDRSDFSLWTSDRSSFLINMFIKGLAKFCCQKVEGFWIGWAQWWNPEKNTVWDCNENPIGFCCDYLKLSGLQNLYPFKTATQQLKFYPGWNELQENSSAPRHSTRSIKFSLRSCFTN